MKDKRSLKSRKKMGAIRRKKISLSQEDLVTLEGLQTGQPLPQVFRPQIDNISLSNWVSDKREYIHECLLKYGALLFRGFSPIKTSTEFESLLSILFGDLLKYMYASTPRTALGGHVYTSTEYPANQTILLHNEMSYANRWPMKIGFLCVQPAENGGETPIADSRRVFHQIDPKIRERFTEKKVMYVRNYGMVGVPWQEVFHTTDKQEVESFCRSTGIDYEWLDENRLRTRQICQAVAHHPQTGEVVWFNQAHAYHISSLEPSVRDGLLAEFRKEELPRNAYYGDGSSIEDSVLAEIREVYAQEQIMFPWKTGDMLLLDNMLMAHGRTPFSGSRKILVGMAEPYSDEVSSEREDA